MKPTKQKLYLIYPDPDDFDAPDDFKLEGLYDPPGWLYWRYKELIESARDTADSWLFTQVIQLNGKPLTLKDLEENPVIAKGAVASKLFAYLDKHLSRYMARGVKIKPQGPEGQLWVDDTTGKALVKTGDLTIHSIQVFRKMMGSNPTNAVKWGLCQVYSFGGNPLTKSDFPKGEDQDPGVLTWEAWSLAEAYFLKEYFSDYLAS